MAVDFYFFFEELRANGVYDYLLPFLLIFVVLFAILEKTMIFGATGPETDKKPKTNINIVFALLVSAIVIFNTKVKEVILGYLPGASLVIVIAIMFMLVAAMFSTGSGFKGFGFTAASIIALVAVFWSLSDPVYGAGWDFIRYAIPEGTFTALIVVALIVAIIFFIRGNRGGRGGHP